MLGIVTGVLLQDHEVRKTEFQQLPYHRIFIMLLLELNAPESVLEAINFQVTGAHVCHPAPGYLCCSWLRMHRSCIGLSVSVLCASLLLCCRGYGGLCVNVGN